MTTYYDYEPLIGKKVLGIYIDEDHSSIKIQCENSWFELVTEGDCCSETWIEHITDLDDLVGEVITGVKENVLGPGMGTKQAVDELYSLEFLTSGYQYRTCGIEFRNSSNGYYGGSLELSDSDGSLVGYEAIEDDF